MPPRSPIALAGATLLLLCSSLGAQGAEELLRAGIRVVRDLTYFGGGQLEGEAGGAGGTTLDIYVGSGEADQPALLWVHGGGWSRGDKANVGVKPLRFVGEGYVFVSINYRLHPGADFRRQAQDVAHAVSWISRNAETYGIDRRRLFLMGHSAGAHLAALVATDPTYLRAARAGPDLLSGVVLLDSGGYDIPRQTSELGSERNRALYRTIFGNDEAQQRAASPLHQVERERPVPPFLVVHVARRDDARAQAEGFVARLRETGHSARLLAAEGKTHRTLNRELGSDGDLPTEAVLRFLTDVSAAEERNGP